MNALYLGWNSPRKAWALPSHRVCVLVDGDRKAILVDARADEFRQELTCLSHHMCGVRKSAAAEQILKRTGPLRNDHEAYDEIFYRYFDPL